MAWKDTLQDASYKGVKLAVCTTQDSAERALVRHEYPYRDGAEVEDLGRRARMVRIQAVFWGKDYEAQLKKLLEVLEKSGPGELIHPVFGSMNAAVLSHVVDHSEEDPDFARVHLELVEAEPDAPFFGGASASGKALANASKLQGWLDKLKALNISAVQGWAGKLTGTLSQVARGDLLGAARGVFTEGATLAGVAVPTMPGIFGQGAGLLGTAQSLVSNVSTLATTDTFGRFAPLASLSGLLPQFSVSETGGSSGTRRAYPMVPALYAGTPVSGPLTSEAAPRPVVVTPPAEQTSPAPAPDLSTPAGQGRAMAAATLNLASAMAVARASSDVLVAETAAPSLTPAEVEAVVGVSRQRFQDTIEETRVLFPTQTAYPMVEAMRSAALAVQDLGSQVIRLHPPVVALAAPALCNLHLLAHWLYGDFSRSEELSRLNPGVRNPNFIAARQVLSGYAK